jgi:superfamily I DNA/RNA helicase
VAVTGGPGTGKSIASLWRHIQKNDLELLNVVLLTYTTTLVAFLKAAARSASPGTEDSIFKTQDWYYHQAASCDEMIIDEAQDTAAWMYRGLQCYAPVISYGADDQQSIYPEKGSTQAELKALFPDNEPYLLDENFRNTYEIMRFVQAALPHKLIPPKTMRLLGGKRRGPRPIVVTTNYSSTKQDKEVLGIIRTFYSANHNIGVLVPFKWQVDHFYKVIDDEDILCTKYHTDDQELPAIENVHVTTFASAKGTEFDTVIIPNFQNFRLFMKTKFVATENHYYVALTRARANLYLLSHEGPNDIDSTTFEIDDH